MNDTHLVGKKILIVDDEEDLRDIVASEFEFIGAYVFRAENITKAKNILSENSVDLIISDIRMPGGTGIDLLQYTKSINTFFPPVILITGFADITPEEAHNLGADALLNKPFMLDDLISVAARSTSTLKEKYLNYLDLSKILQPTDQQRIHFGRGGFTLEVPKSEKVSIGENVGFEFQYSNNHFKGSGICRWNRVAAHDPNKMIVGLEILNLTDDSLLFFEEMMKSHTKVSFIPSAKL